MALSMTFLYSALALHNTDYTTIVIDYSTFYQETLARKAFAISKLESDEARFHIGFLYYEYKNLALCELFLKRDIRIVKGWFYKAARVQELQYRIGKGEYPVSVQLDKPNLGTDSSLGFIGAVLSDSESLMHNFAEATAPLGDQDEYLTMYGYYLSWAMKYLLLGQPEEAHDYILKAQKKQSRYHKGYAWVVQGILEKESAYIQKGLDMQLALHRRMEKGSIFYDIDVITTALTKLAIRNGISVDVPSSLVNKELLTHDSSIKYEDITEVLRVLHI